MSTSIILALVAAGLTVATIITSAVVYFLVKKGYIKLPDRFRENGKEIDKLQREPSLLSDASPSRRTK